MKQISIVLFLWVLSISTYAENTQKKGAAVEEKIPLALQVMGYGYEVSVSINGKDMKVKGGKSEASRLFSSTDSRISRAAESMKHLFVLKPGKNTIKIEYKKIADTNDDKLVVEVKESMTKILYVFEHKLEVSKKLDGTQVGEFNY